MILSRQSYTFFTAPPICSVCGGGWQGTSHHMKAGPVVVTCYPVEKWTIQEDYHSLFKHHGQDWTHYHRRRSQR